MVKGITIRSHGGIHNLGGNARFGDLAYFPGSGPPHKTCDDCAFMVHSRNAKFYGRCKKSADIRKISIIHLHYVDRWTAACRYFVLRPADVTPWGLLKSLNSIV